MMISEKYQTALDAYAAFLRASGHQIALNLLDEDGSECYLVTYGRGSYFHVHTLIEGGSEPVSIEAFETMAKACAFAMNQAVHTYVYACDSHARYISRFAKPADETELARQIGTRLAGK